METKQISWTPSSQWSDSSDDFGDADLVLVFADADYFQTPACYEDLRSRFPHARIAGCSSSGSVNLRSRFPHARIAGCSSSGSVLGNTISDADVVATAVRFKHGTARLAVAHVTAVENIRSLAAGLMETLKSDELRHVLVFSDGLLVN